MSGVRWVKGWAEGKAEDVDGGEANVFGVSGAAKTYSHDALDRPRPVIGAKSFPQREDYVITACVSSAAALLNWMPRICSKIRLCRSWAGSHKLKSGTFFFFPRLM